MTATAQLARARVRRLTESSKLRVALGAMGFTPVVAQIVLLRELFLAACGNELSLGLTLAVWLLLTAAGSALAGIFLRRVRASRLLAFLFAASAFSLFASIAVVRFSRGFWNAMPGEVLGPVPVIVTACVSLAMFCPFSGSLFAAGARAWGDATEAGNAEAGSSTYLLEAIGAAAGGVLASAVFVRYFDSLRIAAIIATVNCVVAVWVGVRSRTVRRVSIACALAAGAVVVFCSEKLEVRFISNAWPGFHVVGAANSRYGNLAVLESEGGKSVLQSGLVLFTIPDPASAEEAVYFPLLEHPAPHSVLLIGGGLNGSLAEVLRHPSITHVDYVELDPELLRISRAYFPQLWADLGADPRLHVHNVDGRLFLKARSQPYDAVIVNVPEPQTAQLNRFYTEDFFREVQDKLADGGVLGFRLHAAEEYISPDLAQFLRCIHLTLRRVFTEVAIIPGENVHFLAAKEPTLLTRDPALLLSRLHQREIQTTYMREYYLPFRMTPERIADLDQQLAPGPELSVNRDFAPVAYYFDVALWGSQFSTKYRDAFLSAAATSFTAIERTTAAIGLVIAAVFAMLRRRAVSQSSAGFATAVTGLTLMGSEVLLLLGFQAIYGYVFDELAAIVAGFMAGMALGSWVGLRRISRATEQVGRSDSLHLLVVQAAVALLPLGIMTCLQGAGRMRGLAVAVIAHAGLPAVAILCGVVGGYQFPIAMRIFSCGRGRLSNTAGLLYALDLLGASFGAIAITIYTVPVFGFVRATELMTLASLGPLLLTAVTVWRVKAASSVS